jgi:hypothetical protein
MSYTHSPEWVSDLVIYEIATRSFTSPNGPGSGTFRSLSDRIPYLADLGITGIWLTGHNLADDRHFYNIWTQYAVLRPDVLEPRLGTEVEFSSLIEKAHGSGIRVFLDVITHGVMASSPLVSEHPEWFREGTWGMTDYDWFGGHQDLDEWWVDTWSRYVRDFGVDGFRLDVSMYRPDLWARIRERAREAGKQIIVFHENGPGRRGVVDFLQWGIRHKANTERFHPTDQRIMRLPHTIGRVRSNDVHAGYLVTITTTDGREFSNAPEAHAALDIVDAVVERAVSSWPTGPTPYSADELVLSLEGLPPEEGIEDIRVEPVARMTSGALVGNAWMLKEGVHADYRVRYERSAGRVKIRFPEHQPNGSLMSLQLSCHDDGWEGFPKNANPYVAGHSRFAFGYGLLLAPCVPIFMSGEEFAADYRPLPSLTPGLFGAGEPGRGTWLYGSWLQWEQVGDLAHRSMLDDVKRLLSLRRRFSSLIRPLEIGGQGSGVPGDGGFYELDSFAPRTMPTPYAYCDSKTLLVIAGNPYLRDRSLSVDLPWKELPLSERTDYTVEDLWNDGSETQVIKRGHRLEVTIPADRAPGGGVGLWLIRPAAAVPAG